MAARKRRSSRQKVSLSISLRTACPPLKACRRPNSSNRPTLMSAFGSKADMCSAKANVRFGPVADQHALLIVRGPGVEQRCPVHFAHSFDQTKPRQDVVDCVHST